jgi:hypothetical protein
VHGSDRRTLSNNRGWFVGDQDRLRTNSRVPINESGRIVCNCQGVIRDSGGLFGDGIWEIRDCGGIVASRSRQVSDCGMFVTNRNGLRSEIRGLGYVSAKLRRDWDGLVLDSCGFRGDCRRLGIDGGFSVCDSK